MLAPVLWRRNYLINKAFQMNFILRFVLLLAIGGTVSGALLYFYMAQKLAQGSELVYYSAMDALLPAILITQLTVGVVLFIATVIIVLVLSHRVAGPLYRLERVAEHVGNGDFTVRVGFRRKDALMPLKSSFQTMITKLEHKLKKFQGNLQDLRQVEREFREKIDNSNLPDKEKERLTAAMRDCIMRFEENLKSFKMSSV